MDSKGVMGFPMRLTLAFILLALCVPVLSEMTEGFRDGTYENDLDEEAGNIIGAADKVFYGGSGASASLHVSVNPGYEIVVGGDGADAYSVSIVKGNETIEKTYLEHPSVMFIGDAITLTGEVDLYLYCVSDESSYGVGVEVL